MSEQIIDWSHCLKLANENPSTAQEILQLFVAHLPIEYSEIHTAFLAEEYLELKKRLHKLHGALHYCSAPQLKSVVHALEMALKHEKQSELTDLIARLDHEVKQVLSFAPRLLSPEVGLGQGP